MDELDALEEKIRRLKREYDLFLAGQRRTEPAALRTEVEAEVLRLSRDPYRPTASRFRLGNLANRFRAFETQLRNISELRETRRKEVRAPVPREPPSVVVDRASIEAPGTIERHLRSIHEALVETLGDRPAPALEALRARLLEQARAAIERPGVQAVRFTVTLGETGPKIRGQLVTRKS